MLPQQTATEKGEQMDTLTNRGAMSVNEFLAWASIGRSKFYEEVNSQRLAIRKVGRKTLVTMADAQAWLDSLPADEMEAA